MSSNGRGAAAVLLSSGVLTAGAMALIFLTMTVLAFGFPPGARLMPLLAGIPGSALALVSLVRELRHAAHAAAPDATAAERAERLMLAWSFAFFAGILAAGFLVAVPVLVVAYLRLGAGERWMTALIGAAASWLVLYGLFELAFGIPLFAGLVADWVQFR